MDLTFIKSYLHGDKKQLITNILAVESVVCFCFVICSFIVGNTSNVGFNCVLTGFLNVAFIIGSYYVTHQSKSPIAVGFLIGVSAMMTILSFMTAVYWGQLSRCEKVSYSVAHYSCTNRGAYAAVCTFSVFLFLIQVAFTAIITVFRGDFITAESSSYQDISSSSTHPYDVPGATSQFTPQSVASADL
eukprot:gene7606-10356_t